MNKAIVRNRLLCQRNDLSHDRRHTKNKKIIERLEKFPLFQRAKNILCFISRDDEICTHVLVQKYISSKNIIVPVSKTATKTLELYHLKNWNDLIKGPFRILEPQTREKPFQKNRIDLAILPGIAFDRKGSRIGHGEGYFDRLLEHMKATKVALAYHFQIMKKLPNHPHDVPMDFIITEREIIDCTHFAPRSVPRNNHSRLAYRQAGNEYLQKNRQNS